MAYPNRNPKRRAIKWALSFFLIMICLGVGTGTGLSMFVANSLEPVEASDETQTFTITRGSNSSQVAESLQQAGLIRSSIVFSYYLKFKKEGTHFQAGDYALTPGMELDEMIRMFNQGETIPDPMIRFTIPEGFTIPQIADRLSEEGFINRDQFIALVNEPQSINVNLMKEVPENENMLHALEGYLFPETYELKEGRTEQEIIERLVSELEAKLGQLPADWRTQLEVLGINFHEMLTVASLVEREVVVDEERPIVAGIIYNRLHDQHRLEIDATVQYALGEQKEILLHEDLDIESFYNTYEHVGLPPGPIANPGIDSIRAALYPEETDYYYYVTKKDGTYRHLFAVTYNEHLKNIAASKQANP